MIRVLPEEFDLNKMKKLKELTLSQIVHPSKVVSDQLHVNHKFAKKLVEVQDLLKFDATEPTDRSPSAQDSNKVLAIEAGETMPAICARPKTQNEVLNLKNKQKTYSVDSMAPYNLRTYGFTTEADFKVNKFKASSLTTITRAIPSV